MERMDGMGCPEMGGGRSVSGCLAQPSGGDGGEMSWSKMEDGGSASSCPTQPLGGDGAEVLAEDGIVPRRTRDPSLSVPKDWYG